MRDERDQDEQQDWPPPLVQGEPVPLPGMDQVEEKPAPERYPR